ncbi:LysR family substrate-binding domain-containing protein [Streptomyces sp. ISL-90]|nr:LysR family substrate-binding domain-containing protein [Streptomyces sp. ISL-90]
MSRRLDVWPRHETGAEVTLRLRYVAGVSPAKWLRAWGDRRPDLPVEALRVEEPAQLSELVAGEADLAFVRLPVDLTGLHSVQLWEELAVAALPKEHPLADAEALTLADLEGEPLALAQPDAAMTMELVAAGTGHAIMPHGVARLHHRRDVVAVPLTDAAPTRIALVWRVDRDDADIQEFVAVVRGRTARSSRREEDEAADEAEAEVAETAAGGKGTAAGKGAGKSAAGKSAGKAATGKAGTGKAASGKGGAGGGSAKPRTGGKAANRGGRGAGGGTKSGRPGKGSKGGAHGGGKGGRGRGGRGR